MNGLNKQRIDKELLRRGLANSRSQAEDTIRRGFVKVNGMVVTKAGFWWTLDQKSKSNLESVLCLVQAKSFIRSWTH